MIRQRPPRAMEQSQGIVAFLYLYLRNEVYLLFFIARTAGYIRARSNYCQYV